ncbi:MAG TPA: NlpC/P60 family protein [Desulfonatronum sp.]|nr:NlpC/P60 family protein [Desulfonatronum sp.]
MTPSKSCISRNNSSCCVLFLALLGLLFSTGCAPRHAPPRPAAPGSLAHSVVQTARSQVGIPYKRAGISPHTGFDCSGLVNWVYAQHGFSLPRTSAGIFGQGMTVPVQDLRAGDLVFFRIGKQNRIHVGIATGQGTFIHSPKPGQRVREENLFAAYWAQRKIGVRRVL